MNKSIFIILFAALFTIACNTNKEKKSSMRKEKDSTTSYFHTLKNDQLILSFLSQPGGRIVYLSTSDSKENILKSNPDLWHEPDSLRANKNFDGWKEYNGHIVWLGPQSEWWIHQDLNSRRKKEKAPWPPDPYLIYGDYKIDSLSDSFVKMTSPESPYTGIQLQKTIELASENKIKFTVKGTNTRDTAISWDLWLNTRFNGYHNVYVPCSSKDGVQKMDTQVTPEKNKLEYKIVDGFFTLINQAPDKGKNARTGKAFLYPDTGLIAGFTDKHLLIIRFEKHKAEAIHPEQGLVELYNNLTPDTANALLELEYHAPYKTLQPDESMQARETWEVYKYNGKKTVEEQINFLKTRL